MIPFAESFPDERIVSALSAQLIWSHIVRRRFMALLHFGYDGRSSPLVDERKRTRIVDVFGGTIFWEISSSKERAS
jgi:hypothetical protein